MLVDPSGPVFVWSRGVETMLHGNLRPWIQLLLRYVSLSGAYRDTPNSAKEPKQRAGRARVFVKKKLAEQSKVWHLGALAFSFDAPKFMKLEGVFY